MFKTKVKIPRCCPYRLSECRLPEEERCPCLSHSTDPVEWRKETSEQSGRCSYVGYDLSMKGWREKYKMLTESQVEDRNKAVGG